MGEVLIIEPIDLNYRGAGVPLPDVAVSHGEGGPNLTTADPREIWQADDNVGNKFIYIDLGADTAIDAVYLGNTNAVATSSWSVLIGTSADMSAITYKLTSQPLWLPTESQRGSRHPAIHVEPMVARYLRLDLFKHSGAPFEVGSLVIGKAFRPTYGREVGEGRTSLDAGFRGRLEDGSLSTVEGPLINGFKWTFGDLLDAERKALMGIIRRRKTTRPILVIEDAEAITAESLRYGTFADLQQYSRLDPRKNRWEITVEDWIGG